MNIFKLADDIDKALPAVTERLEALEKTLLLMGKRNLELLEQIERNTRHERNDGNTE